MDEECPAKGLAMSDTVSLSSTSCWQKVLRSEWCRDMNDKRPELEITTRFPCSEEKNELRTSLRTIFLSLMRSRSRERPTEP